MELATTSPVFQPSRPSDFAGIAMISTIEGHRFVIVAEGSRSLEAVLDSLGWLKPIDWTTFEAVKITTAGATS